MLVIPSAAGTCALVSPFLREDWALTFMPSVSGLQGLSKFRPGKAFSLTGVKFSSSVSAGREVPS